MDFFRENILTILMVFPLVGVFLVLLPKNDNGVRWVANIWSFLGFLLSLPLIFWFDKSNGGMQFEQNFLWIPSIGARFHVGIDGISFLLIMLTTLMGWIS